MSRQALIVLSFILSIVISACTGLGGEPEIVVTVPQPTSSVEADSAEDEPLYPQTLPDIANGAEIFADNCTDCHGENGQGQGALVLEGAVPPPIDMTDLSAVGLRTPLQWYDTITNGRIDFLMPPWKNSLTAQERWDVAYYAYTLGYTHDVLALGEFAWTEKCADCASLNSLINLEEAVKISDAVFGDQVDTQDFGSTLADDEKQAAAAYARSLSVTNPESIASIPETLPIADDPTVERGSLTGTVVHGTANSTIPADTVIQLQYGNTVDGFEFAQTTMNDDFTYSFDDIPLSSSYTYHVGAVYRNRLFTSTLFAGRPDDGDYEQTISIYDLTDDPFVISVSRTDLFIDAINVPEIGRGLQVTQIIAYENDSDRMYTTGQQFGENLEPSLLVQVPVGALITSDEENGRFLIVEDMDGVLDSIVDTYPVMPGDDHKIIVEYFIPYEDGAIIDQPFNNVIDGEVTITLSSLLNISSDYLTLQDTGNANETAKVYSGQLSLDSNPSLVFEIEGDPFVTTSQDETVVTTESLFPLLMGSIIVMGLGVILVIMLANRGGHKQDVNALVKQIAELDAMHDSGQINHDVYQRQRQELKEQLTLLMQQQSTPDPPTSDE